jgi:trehalose-phosphatase
VKPLLSDELTEVGERIARAPHLLLGLDYDGTITPIVDRPSAACLATPMRHLLESLDQNPRVTVAVVSGRERGDLQARVNVPNLIYAGNHGLEISGRGLLFVEPTAAAHSQALKELAVDVAAKLQAIPGTLVEYKGLTLAIHYRRVAEMDCEEVRRITHAILANTSHPFVLTTGDKVYDIRPRTYWHKGTALRWIKEQLGTTETLVIYLGDDVTDEDAFAALPDDVTVKVGSGEETQARYRLEGPADVQRFLEWLKRKLGS